MAIACRSLVEDKFTWRKAIKRYAKLYNEVLAPKEQHPKVSVIITNYKLEHYLLEAITSVLQQENFPLSTVEVIIVNDASPTWNTKWADGVSFGELAIKVIHNETNKYLAGALNTGIAAATGDYIVCLDADNLLGPRALATLVTALDNDRTLDIVYGAMALYDTGAVSGWPGEFNYRAQITHHNQIPSTCMYRRCVWERSGGYRERCRTAEDADFWCRVTSLGFKPKKVTDAVTLIYRDRDDSMSRTERDWPWHEWYTWNRYNKLMPFVAPQQADRDIKVPTYEPVKISVVIPVGPGHERIVIDAIDSLVAQTFQQWECIVVNDTGAPLPWIHPFVKVVTVAIKDEGEYVNRVSRARNLGISLSRGKYFVLLDADDYLQPSALSKMYDTITQAEANTAYAYTDWYVAETKERHSTPNYSCTSVLDRFNHAVTCIYLREAWEKVNGFDQQLKGWEDWDFVIALNVAGYCGIRVPYPLLQYRINGGKRREELYARLDENKAEMRVKWHEYIDGDKKMACGCQNGNGVATASRQAGDGAGNGGDGMVQLEYVGEILGPLNYVGKVTGNRYLFGTEPEHTVKYVMIDDVPALLSVEGFRYYDEGNNEPVLEALGPPQREEVGELVNA
jgi:glycosyltransferase involved in cell wall biosynthesis